MLRCLLAAWRPNTLWLSAASEFPRPGWAKRQEFCIISEYTEVASCLFFLDAKANESALETRSS